MPDQLIPDGTYTVRGPGGLLTMNQSFPGIAMLPPDGGPSQQWKVACDAGVYTVRSAESDLYLGTDDDPNEPAMIVRGARAPFTWKLSTGDDDDETTYVLTSVASSDGFVLSMSLLRIFPPLVAILPPRSYSTVEWAFDRA
jgi:hypothetical protein